MLRLFSALGEAKGEEQRRAVMQKASDHHVVPLEDIEMLVKMYGIAKMDVERNKY